MANTLTSLVPTMYEALDIVSRELVGFIPAVSRNSGVERAALNQTVLVPVTPTATSANNTPAVTAPDTGDQTIENVSIGITKSKHVPVRWGGEEVKGLTNAGSYAGIMRDRFAQAMRTLVNEIEVDIFTAAYKASSRAYGTAGTAPFGTAADFTDFAQVRKILDDNGAPPSDLHLVLNTAAIANLRGKQSGLFKVNEAGGSSTLREGIIDRIEGMDIHTSAGITAHTKGTGAGTYAVDLIAGYAVGDTAFHVDTGTGTLLAGDVVTFAGDTNKYIVKTGFAGDGDMDAVLNKPGLKATLANDVVMTIGNSYTPNLAFHRGAIGLVTRLPALPQGGDAADDAMQLVDPNTGLAFEVAVYRQFLQTTYHVRIAWGTYAIKSAHIATLLG